MLDVLCATIFFVIMWIISIMIIKTICSKDPEVREINTRTVSAKIEDYVYGTDTNTAKVLINDTEIDVIDANKEFASVIEENFGKYILITIECRMEGTILLQPVHYLVSISPKQFWHHR